MTITIKDENFAGKILREIDLSFSSTQVTVREIISARVQQEVSVFNKQRSDYFQGLVEPNDAEKTLNGFKVKNKKVIDAEKQVYVALDAFQKNGYFVLVDHVQSESLDQVVKLHSDTTISFIQLTPLVGG